MCSEMEASEIRKGFHARFVKIPRNTFIWWRNFFNLAPVVQTSDSAIQRINHYPADSVIDFRNTYPLDSDLSGG